jgi:hypothetical protein
MSRKTKSAHRGQKPPTVQPRILVVKACVPGTPFSHFRGVTLVREDGGSREMNLHSGDYGKAMTLPAARDLVAWALEMGIPVECDPPGNLSQDFAWPVTDSWQPETITELPPIISGSKRDG